MATYRLSLRTLSRADGRNAVAAASYRAGERLRDHTEDTTHDYQRRAGVERTALVGWQGSREELWNAAEQAERRKNSRVAREVQVSIPHELPSAARWELTLALSLYLREQYGVAVDACLHRPGEEGDDRNHHAHLLFTTRAVTEGVTCDAFGEKTRTLDDRQQGPQEVERMREVWSALCNHALAEAGEAARVDHRSYIRRGVERESEHVGLDVHHQEASGETTEQGQERTKARRRNRARSAAHQARQRTARTPPTHDELRERIGPTEGDELRETLASAQRRLDAILESAGEAQNRPESDERQTEAPTTRAEPAERSTGRNRA